MTETEMGSRRAGETLQPMPDGKRNGGDLGYFPRGEMTKDFDVRASRRIVGALFFASRPSIRVVVVVVVSHSPYLCPYSLSYASSSHRSLGTRAPLHKPVGPHQTSNGFHVIMVHDRHLANAEMREQARIATEEAKKNAKRVLIET